jgi:hypothetical protein
VDSHTGGGGNAVTVSGGLFNVQLGGGTVTDGSGTGTYTALDQVFRDYGTVWLEIKVGTETLSPRVRVQSAAYAMNAANLQGKNAASFLDTSSTQQTKSGRISIADASSVAGYGMTISTKGFGAVYGYHTTGGAQGYLGLDTTGVLGLGTLAGGSFADSDGSGSAYVGYGDYGIQASGNLAGGYFTSSAGNFAYVGNSVYGIQAYGNSAGGSFGSNTGVGYAYVGETNYGIQAYGTFPSSAGYFKDLNYTGQVSLGAGDTGIVANGSYNAGEFTRVGTTVKAYLGGFALGSAVGVYGTSNNGLADAPGMFYDFFSGNNAWVGSGSHKIYGNGSVSFIQNHPSDRTKTITYTSPEGDETAVYTRGTARLRDGEARVALGETFALVANPDVGLTATVTPAGELIPLTVVAKSTRELLVRGPAGSSAAFDYMVWGLRIGFEDRLVVQKKQREAYIPSHEVDEMQYAENEELRQYSALSRFSKMREEVGAADGVAASPLDLTASHALESAIHVYDRRVDGIDAPGTEAHEKGAPSISGAPSVAPLQASPTAAAPVATDIRPTAPTTEAAPMQMAAPAPYTSPFPTVVVEEAVEAGDVLSNDLENPGTARRTTVASDAGVVGVVAGEPGTIWKDKAPLALAGAIVLCRVDATYGAIAPNDLLVASSTPGYAMRAGESPRQGTVVGKALEAWEAGTGTIRVLVMSR